MNIKLGNNSVIVISENVEILSLNDFPVSELKKQLLSWIESVTEENAECFIFKSADEGETGLFRIEPRPNGWQFTSFKEFKRSGETLPLQEWRRILSSVL